MKTTPYAGAFSLGFASVLILGFVGGGTLPALAAEEMPAEIIAVQIRDQGYACDKALSAERDEKFSKSGEDAWVLKCGNASYRVRLIPDIHLFRAYFLAALSLGHYERSRWRRPRSAKIDDSRDAVC